MSEFMSYEELKNHLLSISDAQSRALFCTIYAGMAREGEIARARGRAVAPFRFEDVSSEANKIVLSIHTEKTKRRKKHKFVKDQATGDMIKVRLAKEKIVKGGEAIRQVPIFLNRERWLARIIVDWVNHVGRGPLFDFSTRWVEMRFKEWFPDIVSNRGDNKDGSKHTVHWLRGWRYTHYRLGDVTGRVVDEKKASLLGGWVNSNVPERLYNFTRLADFEDELENKEGKE